VAIPVLFFVATRGRAAPRGGVSVDGKLVAKRGDDRGQHWRAGNVDTLVGEATTVAVATAVAISTALVV